MPGHTRDVCGCTCPAEMGRICNGECHTGSGQGKYPDDYVRIDEDQGEWEFATQSMIDEANQKEYDRAATFLEANGLSPSLDAVEQLTKVFLPCLRIMCDPSHPWDPTGKTWRKSGVLGILTDVRKKFERLWERGWTHGKRHDDSGHDLINYIGFYMRSEDNGWGDWGPPATKKEEQ